MRSTCPEAVEATRTERSVACTRCAMLLYQVIMRAQCANVISNSVAAPTRACPKWL